MGKKKDKKMTLSTPMVLPKKFWKKKQEGEKRPTFLAGLFPGAVSPLLVKGYKHSDSFH